MVKKLLLFLLIAGTACLAGCGGKTPAGPAPDKLYREVVSALTEANSCRYEAKLMWSDQYNEYGKTVKGKATLKPVAYKAAIRTEVTSISLGSLLTEVEGRKYLVGGSKFSEWTDTAWMRVEETSHGNYLLPDEDPFGHILFLEEESLQEALSEEVGEGYLLRFEEGSPALAAMLERKAENWLNALHFHDFYNDGYRVSNLAVSEADFEMTVDSATFLPQTVSLSFRADYQIGERNEEIEHSISFSFLEFGTIESISVPEEVMELSFPLSAVGSTDPDQPMKVFDQSGFGFTINYPLHWRYEITGDEPAAVIFRGPEDTIDYHTYLKIVTLPSASAGGSHADRHEVFDMVGTYYEAINSEMFVYEPNLQYEIDGKTHDYTFSAFHCIYDDLEIFPGGSDYREYVMIIDRDGEFFYLITFATPGHSSNDYIVLGDAMLDSLRFTAHD